MKPLVAALSFAALALVASPAAGASVDSYLEQTDNMHAFDPGISDAQKLSTGNAVCAQIHGGMGHDELTGYLKSETGWNNLKTWLFISAVNKELCPN